MTLCLPTSYWNLLPATVQCQKLKAVADKEGLSTKTEAALSIHFKILEQG